MMIPQTKQAFDLLHEGALAFAEIESTGIRIDTDYLNRTIDKTEKRIRRGQKKLEEDEVMVAWKKRYGRKTKLSSNDQLGVVLFDVLGHECTSFTETEKYKTDEETLSTLDIPFVQEYLRIKKLQKALSTYLIGIRKEVVNGFIHPFFNLHTVLTYRSSSESPNFQNIPIRDPKIGKLIRTMFIPRPGNRIIEIDYSGIEVAIAACYHKDPTMIEYIGDETKDMHRDMAMECYKVSLDEVTKDLRQAGKSSFVFPQFYGDWYVDCARGLWDSIASQNLKTKQGKSIKEHLLEKGIRSLGKLNPITKTTEAGTFLRHIQKVEQRFWKERFPVYDSWKKKWYNKYLRQGYFTTLTGFTCQGWMKKNEVINYPVQGVAFHCLLKSIIEFLKALKKYKMKAQIIGQIHDSAVNDVPENETNSFLELAQEIMVDNLVKQWKWIIVPIEIEAEACEVGQSWADKKEIKI